MRNEQGIVPMLNRIHSSELLLQKDLEKYNPYKSTFKLEEEKNNLERLQKKNLSIISRRKLVLENIMVIKTMIIVFKKK